MNFLKSLPVQNLVSGYPNDDGNPIKLKIPKSVKVIQYRTNYTQEDRISNMPERMSQEERIKDEDRRKRKCVTQARYRKLLKARALINIFRFELSGE